MVGGSTVHLKKQEGSCASSERPERTHGLCRGNCWPWTLQVLFAEVLYPPARPQPAPDSSHCPAAPRLQAPFSLSSVSCHHQADLIMSFSGSLWSAASSQNPVAFKALCTCTQPDFIGSSPNPPVTHHCPGSTDVYVLCSPNSLRAI